MKDRTTQLCSRFFEEHPDLLFMKTLLSEIGKVWLKTYQSGGKILVCGNGGSCADGDHIVGELMKGFLLKRPLPPDVKIQFAKDYGEKGVFMAEQLQCGLPAISLNAHAALISAFCNDVDPELVYAQQVLGYARKEDMVVGISTSGNAENVAYALMTAKTMGVKTMALTGRDGGKIAKIADYSLIVPQLETYRIQEAHMAIYHFLCAFTESEIFFE